MISKKNLTWHFLLLLLIVVSCSTPNDLDPPATAISGISPTHGPNGTIVTITGTGFNTITADSILFNGKKGTILSHNDTIARIKVPRLAGTGEVVAWRNGMPYNCGIFTYDTLLIVTTIAGSDTQGSADGKGKAATFTQPTGITVDSKGNVYVSDHYNHTIRKIDTAGNVTTFAGMPGESGLQDGSGSAARFVGVELLAIDKDDNIIAADSYGYSIRKISPTGVVTTVAGRWQHGSTDGPASTATFNGPSGVTIDKDNNILVADAGNNKIRKITTGGEVSTIAGAGDFWHNDGPVNTANFAGPVSLATSADGAIYVVEGAGHSVRKISGGMVSTFAGTTQPGDREGTGSEAAFYYPHGIAIDKTGNLFLADFSNQGIKKITPEGRVSRYTTGAIVNVDEPGVSPFYGPYGIAIDKEGSLFVTDYHRHRVRKISID